MATSAPSSSRQAHDGNGSGGTSVRRSTETKASTKTTEFLVFLAMVAAVLIAALIVDDGGDGGFGAKQSWLSVTILTVGYMVRRGPAKSGSRDPYTEDR